MLKPNLTNLQLVQRQMIRTRAKPDMMHYPLPLQATFAEMLSVANYPRNSRVPSDLRDMLPCISIRPPKKQTSKQINK